MAAPSIFARFLHCLLFLARAVVHVAFCTVAPAPAGAKFQPSLPWQQCARRISPNSTGQLLPCMQAAPRTCSRLRLPAQQVLHTRYEYCELEGGRCLSPSFLLSFIIYPIRDIRALFFHPVLLSQPPPPPPTGEYYYAHR